MCGIAGILRFDGTPVDVTRLNAMGERLRHRGPDGAGTWWDGPVGFAHRRLSIIDPAGSEQPMSSPDGRLRTCFNGEILNYRQLRQELEYPFRSNGDTEVLLALFRKAGPHGVSRLRGQFAYALYDHDDAALWLFRDRLGILPLYYYADAEKFVFASEIKAILAAAPEAAVADTHSLDAYLAGRAVPAPFTFFAGVRKLEPGRLLRVGSDGVQRLSAYWTRPAADTTVRMSADTAISTVDSALRAAVDRCLVADVPVGAYLSGGVDSSLVTAIASRLTSDPVLTVSAAFDGDTRHDETPWARRVSGLLGTDHHEVRVSPNDFHELWGPLTWHRDAPISEPADVAVFRLATQARQHVKVMLSGEGSDELFGGYPKYRLAWLNDVPVPGWLLRLVSDRLPPALARARVALRALEEATPGERMAGWFAPFTSRERAELLGLASHRAGRAAQLSTVDGDAIRRLSYLDTGSWLSDNLLERGDRMSMAASVESRPPFLDWDVVDAAYAIPSGYKVRSGHTKWVVKQVAHRYLPHDVVERRKVGFRVPLDEWFRGSLKEFAHDLLLGASSFTSQVMHPGAVRRLLHGHESGRANEEIRIWTLLCLEIWHRVFFGPQPFVAPEVRPPTRWRSANA
jgi:asparagine synthase (glutamine-hydrolysing)